MNGIKGAVCDTLDAANAETNLELAIVKATSRKPAPPKPKHVRKVVNFTFYRDVPVREIFRTVDNRLRKHDWMVVCRTLLLVHALLQIGNKQRVYSYLAGHRSVRGLAQFQDKTCRLAVSQSRNVRAFAVYLDDKVTSYGETKTDYTVDIDKTATKPSNPGELIAHLGSISRLLNSGMSSRIYLDDVNNPLTANMFRMLATDIASLHTHLQTGVVAMIEQVSEMERRDAIAALPTYQEYVRLATATEQFFKNADKIVTELGMKVPTVSPPPADVEVVIRDCITNARDDQPPQQRTQTRVLVHSRSELYLDKCGTRGVDEDQYLQYEGDSWQQVERTMTGRQSQNAKLLDLLDTPTTQRSGQGDTRCSCIGGQCDGQYSLQPRLQQMYENVRESVNGSSRQCEIHDGHSAKTGARNSNLFFQDEAPMHRGQGCTCGDSLQVRPEIRGNQMQSMLQEFVDVRATSQSARREQEMRDFIPIGQLAVSQNGTQKGDERCAMHCDAHRRAEYQERGVQGNSSANKFYGEQPRQL